MTRKEKNTIILTGQIMSVCSKEYYLTPAEMAENIELAFDEKQVSVKEIKAICEELDGITLRKAFGENLYKLR